MPTLAELTATQTFYLGLFVGPFLAMAAWVAASIICWIVGRVTGREVSAWALASLAFLSVAGAAHADVLPSPSAQGWWDGWKFLIALMGFGVLGMQLLSYFRRLPPIDVDLAQLRAEFLPIKSFEQHREARDREIDNLRREIADGMSRAVEQLEHKTEALRLETKADIKDLLKKISIEVAGVHERANQMLAAVSELRGARQKGNGHG